MASPRAVCCSAAAALPAITVSLGLPPSVVRSTVASPLSRSTLIIDPPTDDSGIGTPRSARARLIPACERSGPIDDCSGGGGRCHAVEVSRTQGAAKENQNRDLC